MKLQYSEGGIVNAMYMDLHNLFDQAPYTFFKQN